MAKRVRPKKNMLPEELQQKIEALEAETDEVKIKELKKLLKKEPMICGALQKNGRVCVKSPWRLPDGTINNGRCAVHKGKPDSWKGKTPEARKRQMANLNPKAALIHGMYSQEFKNQFTKEEVEFYNETVDWFCGNYPDFIDPVNINLLHRHLMNAIKTARQEQTNFLKESRSQNSFEKLMRMFADDLGLTKKYKDSVQHKDNNSGSLAMLFMDDLHDTEN